MIKLMANEALADRFGERSDSFQAQHRTWVLVPMFLGKEVAIHTEPHLVIKAEVLRHPWHGSIDKSATLADNSLCFRLTRSLSSLPLANSFRKDSATVTKVRLS